MDESEARKPREVRVGAVLRLSYEITVDDLVAFNRYHRESSPTMKRLRLRRQWGGGLLTAVVMGAVGVLTRSGEVIFWGVFLGVAYAVIFSALWRGRLEKSVRKLYSEGNNEGVIGGRVMEIGEKGIVERTGYSETRTSWSGIKRIVSTKGYTFVYFSAATANIIPHKGVVEGDYEAFIHELKERHKSYRAGTTSAKG